MIKLWTALPNFVDSAVFRPVASVVEKQAIRASLGLPADAFIVGCVAAVKKHHKRIDYLINEFACLSNDTVVPGREEFEQKHAKNAKEEGLVTAFGGNENSSLRTSRASVQNSFLEPYLLIAGAKTHETAELIVLAESLIPGRYKILTDLGRSQMPDLLRSMDVFVLTSLFEMMPIALLEALASGLPCMVNQHPVLEWMTGAGEKSIEQKHAKDAKGGDSYASGGNAGSLAPQQITPAGAASSPLPPLRTSRASVQISSAGGMAIDMSQEGALAAALAALTPEWLVSHGGQARERAAKMFSKEVVIGLYLEYYQRVMSKE
jgi:glycosyltransferase involved in cell wall biosynthesis